MIRRAEKSTKYALWQIKGALVAAFVMIFIFGAYTQTASAFCNTCNGAVSSNRGDIWGESEVNFDNRIDSEFRRVQRFITSSIWEESLLKLMMRTTEQFTAVALQQAMIIGMFIDAESQLDAQRLLQETQALAHKRYQPSLGMCEFGSVSKSLAASEIRGDTFAVILSKRALDRQLLFGGTASSYGGDLDKKSRIIQFRSLFCNEKDRSAALTANTLNALGSVCSDVSWDDSSFDQAARSRINKDIDYFALVDSPWTMKIDFTNNSIINAPDIHNEDEEHVLAMTSNLFGHDAFPAIPANLLENNPREMISDVQRTFMDMRAIVAKRSVAQNSFFALAAMKSQGFQTNNTGSGPNDPPSARPYMQNALRELGVPAAQALELIGENPSYFAQMEILTKKIYQNPDFYTNLYDKPANVERKTVALQGIKLMQRFDMLKSFLREEAALSVLLEIAVGDLQNEIEDEILAITSSE